MAIQDTATLLKQSQAMLDQTKKEGTTSFKGSSYDTFGSADLNPPGKFKASPVPPATGAAGMQAEIGSNVDYATQQSEKASAARANMETARANVSELIASLRGKTGLTAETYGKKGGVDDIQVELNDINQQIRAEQNALNRRREEIEKNRQGMFGGAMEQEIRNLERESLRKQADLYVIQQGIQGRYDSAKAIADRAVSAYLEEQDILLKQYQFDYEQNKDLFTKAEQREFETLQEERRYAMDAKKETMKTINDLALAALKAGAPTSVASAIQGATSIGEAIKLSGGYFAPKAPTVKWDIKEVNGKDMLFDEATGELKDIDSAPTVTDAKIINDVTTRVKTLTDFSTSSGLKSAVGPNPFARMSPGEAFNAQRSNAVATISQTISDLTLGTLIDKKAQGATFGALNKEEFDTIRNAATKISEWEIYGRKGTPDEGKVIGYKTTENEFKKEWDKITYAGKLDALLKGADPEDIGVTTTDDGRFWTTDSFGNVVEIKTMR